MTFFKEKYTQTSFSIDADQSISKTDNLQKAYICLKIFTSFHYGIFVYELLQLQERTSSTAFVIHLRRGPHLVLGFGMQRDKCGEWFSLLLKPQKLKEFVKGFPTRQPCSRILMDKFREIWFGVVSFFLLCSWRWCQHVLTRLPLVYGLSDARATRLRDVHDDMRFAPYGHHVHHED
jgi:hypothetical protein